MTRIWCILIVTVVVAACGAPGCSGGPRVSGVPFAGSRVVKVGEIVEIRVPAREDGRGNWRVSSFDSTFLSAVDLSARERTSSGQVEVVHRARAKRVGRTEIEFTEALTSQDVAAGKSARSTTISIRIVD